MRPHAKIQDSFERRTGFYSSSKRTPAETTEAWLKCEKELEEISCSIWDAHEKRTPSILELNVLIPLLIALGFFIFGISLMAFSVITLI